PAVASSPAVPDLRGSSYPPAAGQRPRGPARRRSGTGFSAFSGRVVRRGAACVVVLSAPLATEPILPERGGNRWDFAGANQDPQPPCLARPPTTAAPPPEGRTPRAPGGRTSRTGGRRRGPALAARSPWRSRW